MKLSEYATKAPQHLDKEKAKEETVHYKKRMAELQRVMRAQGKYSLLIILQGMDASGKDGIVRRTFSSIPAYGIDVYSFKQPTTEELAHDFLWRVHRQTPKKGQIKIFNRSHYEDVLVTRVLGLIDDETAVKRFRMINDFERIIEHNNTIVLKFYLHVSLDEQKEDLLERMTDPKKFYKHNDNDWKTRKKWNAFMNVYEECIAHTQEVAPWYIVAADQNWHKDYFISQTVVEQLEKLDLAYPPLSSQLDIESLK